tara:strand:+ start:404 stop:802 length:399 start_codon:yes stop_codon:yes gene_type:complete
LIKLFSTLSFEIPKILKKIKIKEIIKTIFKLFKENFDKKEVKELKDFSWTSTFFDEKIPRREGSKVKVIKKEVINPNVIIHPKSIIGLIPLNINDKKAQIVVRTVYKIGQTIFDVVFFIISKLSSSGNVFVS